MYIFTNNYLHRQAPMVRASIPPATTIVSRISLNKTNMNYIAFEFSESFDIPKFLEMVISNPQKTTKNLKVFLDIALF